MGFRPSRSVSRAAGRCTASSSWAGLLGAALCSSLFSIPARAQSGADAGSFAAEAPAAVQPAAAEAPAPEPEVTDPGAPVAPAPIVPKTLRDGQRFPDNMQTWLHQRGGSRPPRVARNAASTATSAVEPPEPSRTVESSRMVRSRRMRSFDEAGITVLSNRLSQPVVLTRVAPTRVEEPAPRPPRPEPAEEEPELEEEPHPVTQTRSLRAARTFGPRHSFDDGFGWASLAAGGSALGLAALWFRRRRRAERS